MKEDIAITGQALAWLAMAMASSLILHTSYLPVWFWALAALTGGWRLAVWMGYLAFPGRVARTLAVVLASIAVYETSGRAVTLESTGAFLVAAGLLKLLEMSRRRDGIVIVFLTMFLQATGFLFSQDLFSALSGVLTLALATTAMVSMQGSGRQGAPANLPVLRHAGALLLLSLPFMLVLYFLFPRLSPLWSMPLKSDKALTGLTGEMAPGDIASLSRSDASAFRVTFEGERPSRNDLYWRALILDVYDGRRWQDSRLEDVSWGGTLQSGRYQYEVILEPTGQQYLPALVGASTADVISGVTSNGLLRRRAPVMSRLRYPVVSTGEPVAMRLDHASLRRFLAVPASTNPQTYRWAQTLPAASVSEFMGAVARHFREGEYFYTLQPDQYGDNDIDLFMFTGRRGFCAHYASATAFAARAAGIPARVVTGYQGGEWHPDGYLMVRQYDAHAWVELWDGRVWQRFDPTAAVAPQRIEFGLERAVADEGTFLEDSLLSTHRYRSINWVNQLRLSIDRANYYWSRWVLGYDGRRQASVLKNWLGVTDYAQGLYYLAGVIVFGFLSGALALWWGQRQPRTTVLVREWDALLTELKQADIDAGVGETPAAVLTKISARWPVLAQQCADVAQLLEHALYQQDVDARQLPGALRRLRRKLRSLRPRRWPWAETTTARNIDKGPV